MEDDRGRAATGPGPRALTADEVSERLTAAGVPLAITWTADDAAGAAEAAHRLGEGPFAVKAGGLLHKSDRGGVVLALTGPDAVADAAAGLLSRLGDEARPLLIQPQHDGLELLVGARRTDALGTVVVVGLGGIHTEVLGDVSRELVPIDTGAARAMLQRLRTWPLLEGVRGEAARDVDAVASLLATVSRLVEANPDIVEFDLNPVLVGLEGEGVVVVDARILVDRPPPPSAPLGRKLDALLEPAHVAVVGVSDGTAKFGAKVFHYLRAHGFPGRLTAVHPSGGDVDGHPRHRHLLELDQAPDLVVAAVPARAVLDVARDAVTLGAGAMLVHSSDFAEIGPEGAALQDELAEILAGAGIPLAGPNSMGIVTPRHRIATSISAGLDRIELTDGGVGLVSSSGALASCVATRLMDQGVGVSHWIHVGNEADLTVADYLDRLADDPQTRTVGILLEDLKDGPRFIAAARRLTSCGVPVFAYSMARSAAGQAAAESHTGAMIGAFEVREEVLRRAGVVSLPTLGLLEDALRLSERHQLPGGDRLAALTFSGGACTIIADEARVCGLRLPPLAEHTAELIRSRVPAFAAVRNPLDVSFQLVTDVDSFRGVLGILAESDDIDALLVQFTTNVDPAAARTAQAVLEVSETSPIPVFVGRFGGEQLAPAGLKIYAEAGIPVLDAPDRTVRAIAALVRAGAAVAGSPDLTH